VELRRGLDGRRKLGGDTLGHLATVNRTLRQLAGEPLEEFPPGLGGELLGGSDGRLQARQIERLKADIERWSGAVPLGIEATHRAIAGCIVFLAHVVTAQA
jgi:hypothetical protein